MTYSYRTSGVWGPGLGRNLTAAEVDENFYQATQDIAAKAAQGVALPIRPPCPSLPRRRRRARSRNARDRLARPPRLSLACGGRAATSWHEQLGPSVRIEHAPMGKVDLPVQRVPVTHWHACHGARTFRRARRATRSLTPRFPRPYAIDRNYGQKIAWIGKEF